jgi:quercetin 2,3-dioxygenase
LDVLQAQSPGKGILVKAGTDSEGKPFEFLDATFHVKVSGKDTEGRCVVFDTFRRSNAGPVLHLHTNCDEWFFVIDGGFKFQVGDEIMRLTSGDSLLVPRNIAHAFVKNTAGVGRLIVMHQPAVTMIQQADQTVEGRRVLAEKHGMRFVGPALTPD